MRAFWRLVRMELLLYRSLVRWVLRRPSVPAGSVPIGYARDVTPLMWLWVFASAVEVPVLHLLLPWETAKGTLLALGVWGVLWMLGLLASLRVNPHLLTSTALHVRYSATVDVVVPRDRITGVRVEKGALPSSLRWTHLEGSTVLVGVGGETNVVLDLEPTRLDTPKGRLKATTVRLFVDDPKAFVALLSQRVPAA